MLLLDYRHEMRIAQLHWITSVSCFPCPAADTCLRSHLVINAEWIDQLSASHYHHSHLYSFSSCRHTHLAVCV